MGQQRRSFTPEFKQEAVEWFETFTGATLA
jgi:transposase-like protein